VGFAIELTDEQSLATPPLGAVILDPASLAAARGGIDTNRP
jgi:hypothetical protein